MEYIDVSGVVGKSMTYWRSRIFAKLLLSRIPVSYSEWAKVGLFRHGNMDDFSYAWRILQMHSKILDKSSGWRGLELGPGDGLLSAFLAPAVGATGLSLVDAGDYAHKDVQRYLTQIAAFNSANPEMIQPSFEHLNSIESMLSNVGGEYYSNGLRSLNSLSTASFSLIYSQAVLEHIRRHEFEATMIECRRLLSEDGVMSHVVDFKDHLGGKLNNMRISSGLWERDWYAADSGFYTNRLRLSEILKVCKNAGFNVEIRNLKRWEQIPIKRSQLAEEFCSLSDDDLLVNEAHLIMTPKT